MGSTKTRVPQEAEVYSKLCYQDKIKARVEAVVEEKGVTSRKDKFLIIKEVTRQMWDEEDDEAVKASVADIITEERSKIAKNAQPSDENDRTPQEYLEYVFTPELNAILLFSPAQYSNLLG